MFARLSGVQNAVVFAVLAVALALVMVPLVTDNFITKVAYMWTPGIAVSVMLLIVTRDGYSREGWKSLGLHRLACGGSPSLVLCSSAGSQPPSCG